MVLKKIEKEIITMLSDTILALCRNTLPYKFEFCVEGLLGITMDDSEIFLVNIKETIPKSENSRNLLDQSDSKKSVDTLKRSSSGPDSWESDSSQESESGSSRKRKRRRRKKRKSGDNSGSSDFENGNSRDHTEENDNDDEQTNSYAESTGEDLTKCVIKKEIESDDNDDDELGYVKSEGDRLESCGQSAREARRERESVVKLQMGEEPALMYGQLQKLAMEMSAGVDSGASTSSTSMPYPSTASTSQSSSLIYPPGGGILQDTYTMEKVRWFACQTCGKYFRTRSDRRRHQVTHTGAKPFACNICNKRYGLKENLRRHVRTSHSDYVQGQHAV